MGFHEKLPEYQACVKFSKTIKPKPKNKSMEILDLVSPTFSSSRMISDIREVFLGIDQKTRRQRKTK